MVVVEVSRKGVSQMENRELDILVAERVMGDQYNKKENKWHSEDGSWISCEDGGPKYYSTRMGDSWQIVSFLNKNCHYWYASHGPFYVGQNHCFSFHHNTNSISGKIYQDTAEKAICWAALKCFGVSEPYNKGKEQLGVIL